MDLLGLIASHPVLFALLSPVWGAVAVDLLAFSKSKEPGPFLQTFSVKIALLRYLQAFVGAVIGNTVIAGAVAGAGAVVGLAIWLW